MNKPEPTKHEQLLSLLLPLIEFMDKNEFSYFLVAGKDGTCSRYMRGNFQDAISMLTGMAENNPEVKYMLKEAVNELNQSDV